MSRPRPYVGLKGGKRVVFRSDVTPTEETHPEHGAMIGPFRTIRAARLMASPGGMLQTVAEAEHEAREAHDSAHDCIGCHRKHAVPSDQGSDYCDACIKADQP